MTIKALEHIHKLLLDEVASCTRIEQKHRELRNIEEDKKDADEPNNYNDACKRWLHARDRLLKAEGVLEEFEYENWK